MQTQEKMGVVPTSQHKEVRGPGPGPRPGLARDAESCLSQGRRCTLHSKALRDTHSVKQTLQLLVEGIVSTFHTLSTLMEFSGLSAGPRAVRLVNTESTIDGGSVCHDQITPFSLHI